MKKNLIFFIFAFISIACTPDKMPVTTSSEEALNFYQQGLDLAERLRRLDAIDNFNQAIELDSNFALAFLNRAFMRRLSSERIDDIEKAIEKSDHISHEEKLWIRATEALMNGLPKKAESLYRQLAADFPNDERAQNILGTFLFGMQEYEQAIQYYLEAIRINPDFSQPYNQLGYCYRYLGNYVKAEEAFKKYIRLIPDDPNPYDSYAELLLKMGEFEVSIEMYEKALEIDPDFVYPYTGIATNLNLKDEHEEARKVLMDLFRTARDEGDRRLALINMAISYVDEEKPEGAYRVLEKSYSLAEQQNNMAEMANSRAIIGNILLQYGRIDEAEYNFQQARQLIESSDLSSEIKNVMEQNYLYVTTRIQIERDDLNGADITLAEFKAKAEQTENSPQLRIYHELAGRIAFARKEYDLAIAEFDQGNQQDPENIFYLANCYQGKGDKKKALELFMQAANFNINSSLSYAFVRKKAEREVLRIRAEIS